MSAEGPETSATAGASVPIGWGDRTSRSGDQRPGTNPFPGRRGPPSGPARPRPARPAVAVSHSLRRALSVESPGSTP